jgi:hypothetical protein
MKKVIALLLVLCVVLYLPLSIDVARAGSESYSSKGSDYVSLSIVQPRNITYETSSVQVTISVQANPGIWYVGYSLDDAPFVEVAPQKWLAHIFNETFWLNGFSQGSHNLVVKATAPAAPNDILTVYSNISFSISARVTPNPSTSPTPTPTIPELPSLLILMVLVGSISISIITLRKRSKVFSKLFSI